MTQEPTGRRQRRLRTPDGYHPPRDLPPAFPPADLRGHWSRRQETYVSGSPEMLVLLALIDSCLSGDDRSGAASVESVILRLEAMAAGELSSFRRFLDADADPELATVFALPAGQLEDRLLGQHDEAAEWHSGLSGMTPREGEAFRALLRYVALDYQPWEIHREIARDMTAQHLRHDRRWWLSEETVEGHLSRARGKLRRVFAAAG